jgi:hypothetical protein
VRLDDVENLIADLAGRYRGRVHVDPWQAAGLVQRLQQRGVAAQEFPFTTQSVGRLAHAIYTLLRSHRIALPDDEDLREELLGVRLRENQPGQYRLDHESGRHDDQAVTVALAAHLVLSGDASPRLVVLDDVDDEDLAPAAPGPLRPTVESTVRDKDVLRQFGLLASRGLTITGEPVDRDAPWVGGQPSPFAPGAPAAEPGFGSGGVRSPFLDGLEGG